jgi:hypothetical protein
MKEYKPYSAIKVQCPCGQSNNYQPHTDGHGGKCWSPKCGQKYFKPIGLSTTFTQQQANIVAPQAHVIQPKASGKLYHVRDHIYWTQDGQNYLMKVSIFRDETTGKKQCFQSKWVGTSPDSGQWVNGIKGIQTTLYNLSYLRGLQTSTCKDSFHVLILEGEKDCDSLTNPKFESQITGNFIGTCNPMGSGKWLDRYSRLLFGLNCVIIPDNDQAGETHAKQVRDSILPYAKTVKILRLQSLIKDFPYKGDLTDFLEMGGCL